MTSSHRTLTIALATVLPLAGLLTLVTYLCCRARSRSAVFGRGITPIDDEEIETWKVERDEEKEPLPERHRSTTTRHNHQYKDSAGSIQKPASIVVYQSHGRPSGEGPPQSPRSLHHYNMSGDFPPAAILARAPNARPGLTDEVVQGDDAFLPPVKRQQSRLSKSTVNNNNGVIPHSSASSTPRHDRSRSTRSSMSMTALRAHWDQQGGAESSHKLAPRHSAEELPRTPPSAYKMGHHRVYSSPSHQTHPSSGEETHSPGGLSPRPQVHRSEIGRAIG